MARLLDFAQGSSGAARVVEYCRVGVDRLGQRPEDLHGHLGAPRFQVERAQCGEGGKRCLSIGAQGFELGDRCRQIALVDELQSL